MLKTYNLRNPVMIQWPHKLLSTKNIYENSFYLIHTIATEVA